MERKNNTYKVKPYGRTELAQTYFPASTPQTAWRRLRNWMLRNDELTGILHQTTRGAMFTPAQVSRIFELLGDPQ